MSSEKSTSWAHRFVSRHWGKLLIAAAILLVGMEYVLIRMTTGGPRRFDRPGTKAGVTAKPASAPTVWTCSMHPQIRKDGPGKCPLCGMDLIPATGGVSGGGLRTLTVSPAARALMHIETSPVERKYVMHEVMMVGKVDYDETRLKYITAWVPGRLDRLYVDYTGVEVKKGDHLVYMYSEAVYAAQEELIGALRYARQRVRQTNPQDPKVDLVASAREKLRLWGLTDQQIRAIEQQKTPKDHITIYSPIGGIVIDKLRQEGDRVALGDRIYTVADLKQVWIHLDAYESDLNWIRYGQEVAFTTEAYPGEEFRGRIAFIQPVLDDKTRTVKVRVNVPNPDGRLKPEMFGHGVVHVKVAEGGRVVDAGLAGKWISPMHPEIIKDHPGTCDICGMPLVRAETLGFLAPSTVGAPKPLVIPVSAALVTGKRAVVYVELPGVKVPTFEGREIVLGPRAGDYYIVRSGLGEGELVVTHGNFKIDSEIQIQAKPSMMTPSGGGAATETGGSVPPKFLKQLRELVAGYDAAVKAVKAEDLPLIHAKFAQFDRLLHGVDASVLRGHPLMVWNDVAMLLSNDVVEGGSVRQVYDAKRVAALLEDHIKRMQSEFRLGKEPPQPQRLTTPAQFQAEMAKIWKAYLPIQQSLAADQFDEARQAVVNLQSVVASVDDRAVTKGAAGRAWNKEQSNLDEILQAMRQAGDIKSLRAVFSQLSDELGALITTFGLGNMQPVYQLHCPMALGGQGAIWFQDHEETKNPYFGAVMLGCADQVEEIRPSGHSP